MGQYAQLTRQRLVTSMTPRTTTDRWNTRSRTAAARACSSCCALPSAAIISISSARENTLGARGSAWMKNGIDIGRRRRSTPGVHADRHETAVARNRERDRLRLRAKRHRPARIGVHRVLAVLLVPFGHRRRLVHLLDDVTPADAG